MSQVINTTIESALDAKRHEVVATLTRGYGATKEYAELLFSYFPEDWYSFEHNDKSEEAKGILGEAQKFRDELRKGGHTNPSVVWTRVRQEGAKLAGLGEGEDSEGGWHIVLRGVSETLPVSRRQWAQVKALLKL